jgi:hypothetical protein
MAARALNIYQDESGEATFLFEAKSYVKNIRIVFRKLF